MAQGSQANRILWIVALLSLIPGATMLALGISFGIGTSMFLKHSARATGTVIRLDQRTSSAGGLEYSPVFTYTAEDGKSYTVRSNVWSNPAGFVEGQSVNLLYERSNPAGARINIFRQIWLMTFIFCLLGALFVLPGALFFFLTRKRVKTASALPAEPDANTP